MSKRLVIAGAGGFGRGVFSWVQQSPRHRDQHDISEVVFIDDAGGSKNSSVSSTIRAYVPHVADLVLCAVGSPKIRRQIVESLALRGARFHTFVDDRAVIASTVRLGDGAIVCPGVVVSADAVIGEHVHINFNCSVGHDTTLGAFTTLSPAVNIMGEVTVGEDAFLGGGAVVLPRLTVGKRATVGAGAVCVKDTAIEQTVVGNPAAQLTTRTNRDA